MPDHDYTPPEFTEWVRACVVYVLHDEGRDADITFMVSLSPDVNGRWKEPDAFLVRSDELVRITFWRNYDEDVLVVVHRPVPDTGDAERDRSTIEAIVMSAIAKIDERMQWRTDQLARIATEEGN